MWNQIHGADVTLLLYSSTQIQYTQGNMPHSTNTKLILTVDVWDIIPALQIEQTTFNSVKQSL